MQQEKHLGEESSLWEECAASAQEHIEVVVMTMVTGTSKLLIL